MTTSRLCGSHTVDRIINGVTEFDISWDTNIYYVIIITYTDTGM